MKIHPRTQAAKEGKQIWKPMSVPDSAVRIYVSYKDTEGTKKTS